MPFDPSPIDRPARSKNGMNLAGLRILEAALRQPRPVWGDFRGCGTCALEVGRRIGLGATTYEIISGLGIKDGDIRVFFAPSMFGLQTRYEVQPHHVADAIAAIIRREEAEMGLWIGELFGEHP